MVNSLENIDKSKVSADRITGLDQKIQEELSTAVTGAASTIVTTDLTANRAVISNANGKVAVSSTTSTELGYVHGVTSAIQTQLNAKAADNAVVKLTGNQTIAGVKTFTSDLTLQQASVQPILKSTGYTKGTAPTSDTYMCHRRYLDKNGAGVFDEYYYIQGNTNKNRYILRFQNVSSASATGYKDIITADFDGTNANYAINATTATAPTPATSDNSTKIATTAFVKAQGYIGSANLATCHVVTQTYVNGTSWYRVYDDGWVEQGGVLPKTTSSVSISFMKPFSNENFSMQFSPICPTNISSSRYQREVCINSFTVSNFSATTYDSSAFWYACGKGA